MSRNEIEDVLKLESSETVLRHRRGAVEALLTGHGKSGKPGARRRHADGDDRHERRWQSAHAAMRQARQ